MAFAQDASLVVDLVAGHIHNPRINRNHCVRLNHHAVELQFHPPLAHKVAGILVFLEPAHEVAVCGQNRPAVLFGVANLAQDRITHGSRLR